MQIRTSCGMNPPRRRQRSLSVSCDTNTHFLPSEIHQNVSNHFQSSYGVADTHNLGAGFTERIISNNYKPLLTLIPTGYEYESAKATSAITAAFVMQIRTIYEQKSTKMPSMTTFGLFCCRYALPASGDPPKRCHRSLQSPVMQMHTT